MRCLFLDFVIIVRLWSILNSFEMRPPDTFIAYESSLFRVLRAVNIAKIGHSWIIHPFCQPLQIQPAEFVPFGQKHNKISILNDLIGIFNPANARKQSFAFVTTLGITDTYLGAPTHKGRDNRKAWRIAHIVGIGLKRNT